MLKTIALAGVGPVVVNLHEGAAKRQRRDSLNATYMAAFLFPQSTKNSTEEMLSRFDFIESDYYFGKA